MKSFILSQFYIFVTVVMKLLQKEKDKGDKGEQTSPEQSVLLPVLNRQRR